MQKIGILIFIYGLSLPIEAQLTSLKSEVKSCIESDTTECISWLEQRIDQLEGSQPDSLLFETLLKLSTDLINPGHFDLASISAHRAFRIAKKREDVKLMARATARISAVYVYDGQLDSARFYILQSLQNYRELGDSLKIATSYINLGQIQKEMGLYEMSMVNYMKAVTQLEKIEQPVFVAHAENEIATLYAMTGEVEKAISFGLKAVQTYREVGDYYYEAYAKLNLANNLIYVSQEDTAILLLKEVIPVFKKENDVYMIMNAEAQYGRALYRIGELDQALEHFKTSNSLDPDEHFIAQLAYNHEYLSRIFRGTGKAKLALVHSIKSLKYHRQLGWNEEYKDALHDLAQTYETLGQADSALKYLHIYLDVSDSLSSIQKTEQLNELKTRYETDLKEQQIKSVEAEIRLLQEKNRSKSQRNTALIVAILAITGFATSVIIQQRRAYRLTQRLSMENQRSLRAELNAEKEVQERLQVELDYKKRNLASQALLIAEKNELLRSFKGELESLPKDLSSNPDLAQIVKRMERVENQSRDWDKFMSIFNEVHPDFHERLRRKHPQLSANDVRLSSLMKMNFSNKEMANILHISEAGLKKARYRLRKKMALAPESDIAQYIHKV